jgi:hypothetical protein
MIAREWQLRATAAGDVRRRRGGRPARRQESGGRHAVMNAGARAHPVARQGTGAARAGGTVSPSPVSLGSQLADADEMEKAAAETATANTRVT